MARKPAQRGLIQKDPFRAQPMILKPAVEAENSILALNTKRAYAADWREFFQVPDLEKITGPMVLDVGPDQVADYRNQCLERGLCPGTINRKLSALRTLFDYLILRRMMSVNPAHTKLVRPPKRSTVHKMESLSPEEARVFLGTIDRTTKEGRRDYAVIMMDLHMGLRRSEAIGVRSEQFKTAQGKAYLVFRSKGEKERMITVNRPLWEALAAYSKDRGQAPGWLFPGRDPKKHLSGDQFWRIVQKYLKAAGIRKKIGTHGLRATFITHNISIGTPLSELQKTVGHSRGDTTLGYARDLEMIKSKAPEAMEDFKAD